MPTPKGMRDFSPAETILRKDVFARLEKVFRSFGFDPLETPIVEKWETLKGKYGTEAEEKLIYWWEDRLSGRELALRYDLTVPLARYVAENANMPLPFKRYAIGRVYRHESPQRSRYREFYQCDVDVVGSPEAEADAEVLSVVGAVMDEFKLPGYTVKLNDRRLLRGIFRKGLGIERNLLDVYRLVDKLDKQPWGEVSKGLKQLLPASKVRDIKDIVEIKGDPERVLETVVNRYGEIGEVEQAVGHLRTILSLVDGINIKLDLSMVRGLDYYTGPIFETVVKEPDIGSITGGGRYDGLLARYGADYPATGTTIGVERLIDAGLDLGIFQLPESVAQAYVVSMDVDDYAWKFARMLRAEGVNTRVDLLDRSWRKQLDEADKLGCRFVVIVGPKEKKAGTVTLVDKETDDRRVLKPVEAVGEVSSALGA